MSTVGNVSAGKPGVSGPIYRAPKGTALPTTANATLNDAFKALGYVSEDGVINATEIDTEDIKAWGGDPVLNLSTGFADKFTFTLLETINTEVKKARFGDDNVTGTLADGIAVEVNSKEQKDCSWVIDSILRDGVLHRIVIPSGKVTEFGDIVYVDGEAVGYELTISASPDEDGNTHYEYTKSAAASSSGSGT